MRRPRSNLRPLLPLIGLLLALPSLGASETWTIEGRVYENVRVQTVTDGAVTIFHGGGITQLELATLPPNLQERFEYDPEKATAWKQQAETDRRATEEIKRRALEKRRELASRAPEPAPTPRTDADGYAALDPDAPFELRPEVDLRPLYQQFGLIFKDQGRRPSCSIFALVGALEYEYARSYGRADPLSEEYLIWAVRKLQPGIPIDDGYHFGEVVSALQTHGVARQSVMRNTFGKRLSDIEPTAEALADAAPRRTVVPVWFRPNDPYLVGRIIDALNMQTPVVIGIRWPHWRTLRNNHLLRDQQPLKGAAHAVTIVGYQCPDGILENTVFIFRNSYGIDWGLGGCGLLAASYLHHHTLSAFHLSLPGTGQLAQAGK